MPPFASKLPRMNVDVTYLQMLTPAPALLTAPKGVCVVRAVKPTMSFYRYLYAAVGRQWFWFERRRLNDNELAGVIHDEQVAVNVLYVDGVPAGYVEIDRRQRGEAEIAYFGLIAEFIGRGLGRYFINWTIDDAWRGEVKRVWLHTCSMDHPRAVSVYQSAGLEVYRQETVIIADPRGQFPDLGQ
jgi:GNAT superfamily N-acetyltransferase